MNLKKAISFALPFILGLLLWFLPAPEGLLRDAWHLFALFVATILGIILRPFPMGVIALFGLTLAVITGLLSFEQAFSGFSNEIVWLVVFAFFISRAFIQSGLGERIAYSLMSRIGKETLGLGYGLVATDLLIAPIIPSLAARGGGVIYPLLQSLTTIFTGASHDPRVGAFLTLSAFQGMAITSAMFLTAMAGNPLIALYAKQHGATIMWGGWALAALVPGLLSLAIAPWLIYRLVRPVIRKTPHAREMAKEALRKMGPLTLQEKILLLIFLLMILLWIFGHLIGCSATVTALIGVVLLLSTGVLRWKEILQEGNAWDTFVWFAILITLPRYLTEFGFTHWFSDQIASSLTGPHWIASFLVLSLVYFYAHYFFASNVAHITALFVPFLIVAISVGTPPMLAALSLGFLSNLFGGLTHYGSGPAPILFGTGFVTVREWWKIGALIGLLNIAIWLGIGAVWWKLLGLW
ncbi:MAG: DASS family sodium-coupled anion symporter [Verrucomicrobiota bacterium]|nr:DASS family sodium-coupled anion symporter [Verrucomicrobiota bacterium]